MYKLSGKPQSLICGYVDNGMTAMGRIDVNLDDKLEQRLRLAVVKRYGGKKGDLGKAVEEAIEKWLKEESKE
jgi:hypothetical protein